MLTYAEYTNMGGSLDEVLFNRLSSRAENTLHSMTFNRLKDNLNYLKCKTSIDYCLFDMIEIFSHDKAVGIVASISQSSGGVSESESYSIQSKHHILSRIDDIIESYLQSETTVTDVPLLERSTRK